MALRACLLLLLASSIIAGVSARWRHLREGDTCMLDSSLKPIKPFCQKGPNSCLVTQTPTAKNNKYTGRCNSSFAGTSFCSFGGANFAIGTKNIKDNPLCNTCTCSMKLSIPGPNKAVCKCDALPDCMVDFKGSPVGAFTCPPKQAMCVITAPGGGGRDSNRLPIDKGQCVFSGIPGVCAVAGPNFGPKFYMPGLVGIPNTPSGCTRCICGATGGFLNCKNVTGCSTARGASRFAQIKEQDYQFIQPHLQVR